MNKIIIHIYALVDLAEVSPEYIDVPKRLNDEFEVVHISQLEEVVVLSSHDDLSLSRLGRGHVCGAVNDVPTHRCVLTTETISIINTEFKINLRTRESTQEEQPVWENSSLGFIEAVHFIVMKNVTPLAHMRKSFLNVNNIQSMIPDNLINITTCTQKCRNPQKTLRVYHALEVKLL